MSSHQVVLLSFNSDAKITKAGQSLKQQINEDKQWTWRTTGCLDRQPVEKSK